MVKHLILKLSQAVRETDIHMGINILAVTPFFDAVILKNWRN